MTTRADSEVLTSIGAGTPVGNLMREYWIPAAMSSELRAGGDPMRLLLLGEKLIAFRDSTGRVGIMDHRCPHRCASLFFGRNENAGLRCAYHGWKFDVDGNCLDMPNVPSHHAFPQKIRAKSYKVVERNGLIWTYMGKRETPPPLPSFEPVLLPEEATNMFFVQRECNWLQALEGDIDTSHFGFLHAGGVTPDVVEEATSVATRSSIVRRNITSPTPTGARCMPPTDRPIPARSIGASRISCSHSGRCRPTDCSGITSLRAHGCRWTTPTRCSSICPGRRTRRVCAR